MGSRALQRHTQPPPRDEPNPNLRTRGRRGRDESAPPAVTVSGQDLVDVEFRLLTANGGLLVLAREHLADQAEREELEADDDQEHAERQQRALADRVAESLDDGQVDEDCDSEQTEDEAEERPIGVQICYDFWFNPELTRILALKGCRLILNPVGSFAAPGRPDSMRTTALSRAQENLVYVAVANCVGGPGVHATGYSGEELTGSLRPDRYVGHSMIAGPAFPRFGQLYTEAGDLEEIVVASLSLERLDRFESVFDYRSWRAGRLHSASQLVADEFAALAASSRPNFADLPA